MKKCNSSTTWPKKLPTLETIAQRKSSSKSDKNFNHQLYRAEEEMKKSYVQKRQKMQKYSRQSLFEDRKTNLHQHLLDIKWGVAELELKIGDENNWSRAQIFGHEEINRRQRYGTPLQKGSSFAKAKAINESVRSLTPLLFLSLSVSTSSPRVVSEMLSTDKRWWQTM